MAGPVDLRQMTVSDKLRLMEALWKDLSQGDSTIESPEWHGDILAERDRLIESGQESFLDWDDAKKKLRQELHVNCKS